VAETRTCHIDGTVVGTREPCPTCLAAWPNRHNPAEMTVDERVAEMELLKGPLETDFSKLHQRIEELVGRPVWTHELASYDQLIDEVRMGEHASFEDVVNKLPASKVVLVDVSGAKE
jgi:hypothetical protein